jgi:hypothetical protein
MKMVSMQSKLTLFTLLIRKSRSLRKKKLIRNDKFESRRARKWSDGVYMFDSAGFDEQRLRAEFGQGPFRGKNK